MTTTEIEPVTGEIIDPAGTDLVVVYDARSKAIEVPTPVAGLSLAFRQAQRTLDETQMQLLAPLGIGADWDPGQVLVFLMDCHRRGFDPWAQEAYLMRYKTRDGDRYVKHIGIAGFRARAEDTGEYRGVIGPMFSADGHTWSEVWPDPNTVPGYAKAAVERQGRPPQQAVISYLEFAPTKDEWVDNRRTGRQTFTPMWLPAAQGGKPMVMSGKCAQAAAFRIAFPRKFGGWYEAAEFERLRGPVDDPGAATRRAAFAAAMAGTPTPVATPADPWADAGGEAAARDLLARELDEQAEIVGKPVAEFTARWSAAHAGRPIAEATTVELAEQVRRARRWIADALRDAGRTGEADRYDPYVTSGNLGTVHDLFGRGPAVPDPADTTPGGVA